MEQDRTAGKWTGQESLSQHSTFMSPSKKQENGTSSVALLGIQGCGQSAKENLRFQCMQHGLSSSATSTQNSSLQRGLVSQQSVNEDSMTNPVQHLGVKVTMWGSSSKQSMESSVAQGKRKPFVLILCNNFILRIKVKRRKNNAGVFLLVIHVGLLPHE